MQNSIEQNAPIFISDNWYIFNNAEKKLLLRSWKVMETDIEQVSCGIYTMIFNQCPEARQLFPYMRLPVNESDKRSQGFIFQALRFIQVLESAITYLDDLQSFDPILHNLGRRHGKLESSMGFRPYYWSVFLECTIYNIRLCLNRSKNDLWNDADLDEVIILWRHLVSGICLRIKKGYLMDIANRTAAKDSWSSLPALPTTTKNNPFTSKIPNQAKTPITGEHLHENHRKVGLIDQIIQFKLRTFKHGL
ncbi:unnamed protein product [Dracunculus medinensis]|uniref:Globin domain-containing protein n=1 Tax=Dracunculus medinensis TaxID=318479 RepID=A0A3P7QSY9_DRAME|nr:unnamed protein product [Dracunculus medinensis]